PKTFIEVGCGEAKLSKILCSRGLFGIGIDFSKRAIEKASDNMKSYIKSGKFSLIMQDFMKNDFDKKADLVFSAFVMEHVEDDLKFLIKIKKSANKNGVVIVGVPSCKDKWGIEDEIAGHLRRYDRKDLLTLFDSAGMNCGKIWSVGVPVSNILLGLSNLFILKSEETNKKRLPLKYRTENSGILEIPFKTIFPRFFKIVLNKFTMWPFFVLQRFFYNNTDRGLMMLVYATPK
ncbi:unnamed protein product, partial [marine sediment metagenome]